MVRVDRRRLSVKTSVWFVAASVAALVAGAPQAQAQAETTLQAPVVGAVSPADSTATQHYGRWGFELSGMDRAIPPGDDFYDYADGAAVKALQIPPDRSRYGYFTRLAELSENRVHAILQQAAAQTGEAPQTSAAKIGAFYKAFMDEARVERLGAQPLKPDLDAVRAVTSKAQMAVLMGRADDGFMASVFDLGIQPDERDPDRYSVHLGQSGLGLPDRDYYLTPGFAPQKAKYQQYVAQMLGLVGWPDAQAQAAAIVALETRIAAASWTKTDERDAIKTYNPTTVKALEQGSPGFAWHLYLGEAGLGDTPQLIAAQNTAIPKIAAIYQATPLETLKAWEAFHIVDGAAPLLSTPFVQANFEFQSHVLSGQPQIRDRWKRAVGVVAGGMGEAIGQVYVARYFPPESKAKMQALVANLKAAFRQRLEQNTWMGPATKAEALKKLANYTVRIGYPDKWRDYSTLAIRSDDLYGDVERSQAFEWARERHRLNKPVDKAEWDMTPQEVNAYNMPDFNEVVFPAAILQPPFFDPNADPAVNYGGIGGVIGHEMTHGFDDQGRKFDAQGRLREWWTPQDAARFQARADRLAAQYSAFEPLPGAHVNGKLTLGENIADQGGLTLALDAYRTSLNGSKPPVLNGVTGEQRVFLGWAQVWTSKERDDALREQLVTDPHSPERYRVNGVVRNLDGWYRAFDVKPGQSLYLAPADRAQIW